MKETLTRLRELHQIDSRLIALKKRVLAAREEQALHVGEMAQAQARRALAEENMRGHTLRLDGLQLETRACQAELDDQDKRLKMVRNNAEYDIVTRRVRELRAQIDAREAEILQGMEVMDRLKDELTLTQEALSALQEAGERLTQKLAEGSRDIRAQQQGLKERRDGLVAELRKEDPAALEIYDGALRATRGDALGQLRDHVCQSCFMGQNPAVVDAAMVGRDLKAAQCRGCGRILVPETGSGGN